MDKIRLAVEVNQEVNVDVSVWELTSKINEMPMTNRWNIIAQMLNEINVTDDLEDNQKEVVVKYLKQQLELFEKYKNEKSIDQPDLEQEIEFATKGLTPCSDYKTGYTLGYRDGAIRKFKPESKL